MMGGVLPTEFSVSSQTAIIHKYDFKTAPVWPVLATAPAGTTYECASTWGIQFGPNEYAPAIPIDTPAIGQRGDASTRGMGMRRPVLVLTLQGENITDAAPYVQGSIPSVRDGSIPGPGTGIATKVQVLAGSSVGPAQAPNTVGHSIASGGIWAKSHDGNPLVYTITTNHASGGRSSRAYQLDGTYRPCRWTRAVGGNGVLTVWTADGADLSGCDGFTALAKVVDLDYFTIHAGAPYVTDEQMASTQGPRWRIDAIEQELFLGRLNMEFELRPWGHIGLATDDTYLLDMGDGLRFARIKAGTRRLELWDGGVVVYNPEGAVTWTPEDHVILNLQAGTGASICMYQVNGGPWQRFDDGPILPPLTWTGNCWVGGKSTRTNQVDALIQCVTTYEKDYLPSTESLEASAFARLGVTSDSLGATLVENYFEQGWVMLLYRALLAEGIFVDLFNTSVIGDTVAQSTAGLATRLYPLFNPRASKHINILLIGANSLASGTGTDTGIAINAEANAITAHGWECTVVSVPARKPPSDPAGAETRRLACNVKTATGLGVDFAHYCAAGLLAPFDAQPTLDQDCTNKTYYRGQPGSADFIHQSWWNKIIIPERLGHRTLAEAIRLEIPL